jgi:hypothetical protein
MYRSSHTDGMNSLLEVTLQLLRDFDYRRKAALVSASPVCAEAEGGRERVRPRRGSRTLGHTVRRAPCQVTSGVGHPCVLSSKPRCGSRRRWPRIATGQASRRSRAGDRVSVHGPHPAVRRWAHSVSTRSRAPRSGGGVRRCMPRPWASSGAHRARVASHRQGHKRVVGWIVLGPRDARANR